MTKLRWMIAFGLLLMMTACSSASKRAFDKVEKVTLFGSFSFKTCYTDKNRNDCQGPMIPKPENRTIILKPTGDESLLGEWKQYYIHENLRFWARIQIEKKMHHGSPYFMLKCSLKGPSDKSFIPSIETGVANLGDLNSIKLFSKSVRRSDKTVYPEFIFGPEIDIPKP